MLTDSPLKVVRCIKSKEPSPDVCEYVSSYMTLTYKFSLRTVKCDLPKPRQLFLSYHMGKPIKSATISKYLVKSMELAGIDVGCFKAHTTRGIFPSLMNSQGYSAHKIISQGDWSNVSTFEKHCNRFPDNSPAGILITEVTCRSKNLVYIFYFYIFYFF